MAKFQVRIIAVVEAPSAAVAQQQAAEVHEGLKSPVVKAFLKNKGVDLVEVRLAPQVIEDK